MKEISDKHAVVDWWQKEIDDIGYKWEKTKQWVVDWWQKEIDDII